MTLNPYKAAIISIMIGVPLIVGSIVMGYQEGWYSALVFVGGATVLIGGTVTFTFGLMWLMDKSDQYDRTKKKLETNKTTAKKIDMPDTRSYLKSLHGQWEK